MKNYLSFFCLLFIFGAAKAQVHTPYMDNVSNFVFDQPINQHPNPIGGPGCYIEGVPMSYTDNGTSGEVTYTDGTGTSVDFSWAIVGSTIYWNADVEAPSSDILGLHRLWISDDGAVSSDPETYVDDDFEDGDALGWGSDTWTSSGSASLGSVQRDLFFSFENADGLDHSAFGCGETTGYEHFTATIHYNQPL